MFTYPSRLKNLLQTPAVASTRPQQARQKLNQLGTQCWAVLDLFASFGEEELLFYVDVASVDGVSVDHLVKEHSKCPYVDCLVIRLSVYDLRRL